MYSTRRRVQLLASAGWGHCYWCWVWSYSNDSFLCERCLGRLSDGEGPPWWPNESQRWQLLVGRLFGRQRRGDPPIPAAICDRIASFVARPWAP